MDDTSDDSEADLEDDSDTIWVAPTIRPVDLDYTIYKLLPQEEHDILDDFVVHLFTSAKGYWPSRLDVINDVKLASDILLLVVGSASPNIPLKPEWRIPRNVAILAEQDNLRRLLGMSVLGKSFTKLRSLGMSVHVSRNMLVH